MLDLDGLSGKREGKESIELEPRLRALNVNGHLRLNNSACELLGLKGTDQGFDYVCLAGKDQLYIGAGKAHTPETDEQGNIIKGGNGTVRTKGDGYGSKGKYTTHGKPSLVFSASAAYGQIRAFSGKDEFEGVVVCKLGEGVEAKVKTGNELYPEHITIMYPIIFVSAIENVTDDESDKDEVKEVSEQELAEAGAESTNGTDVKGDSFESTEESEDWE